MADTIGRGWLGSVRRRVGYEIKLHSRENRAMRRARYSWLHRALRAILVGRSLLSFLTTYVLLDLAFVAVEAICHSHFQRYLPDWTAPEFKGLLKDLASYFIAAQVALLGIVSVAIGIVTLISQHNTDVRLYYVESLAYEVVRSGVALLIVLCVQLLWPLQYLAHILGFGGPDLVFKFTLTGFHLAWLVLNLVVFAQFVLTTLHFVEPRARERLRERYTANTVVPRDLRLRLSRVFYMNAPNHLALKAVDPAKLGISFGYGLLNDGDAELKTRFAQPSALSDIRLRPLSVALRNWWRRVEKNQTRTESALHTVRPSVRLAFLASFDSVFDGDVTWCRRTGGTPLHPWERWVIRWSFSFREIEDAEGDLPTPAHFLDELADKVIAQMEQGAVTGFRLALDEAVRYHRFLLDVHDTHTEQGSPLSLAEVGGLWEAPCQEWLRQYRRIFTKAAEKLESDTYFIDALSHVILRLLPTDATDVSAAVVTSLLDLGLHEVIVFEAWVTRRTTVEVQPGEAAQPRLEPAGSDRRAYEEVIRGFRGAWENVLRRADLLYGWKDDQSRQPSAHWNAFARSWVFVERHLRNTAYFLASAVWNEDALGAESYRDTFLRWLDTLRPDGGWDYRISQAELLAPHFLTLGWPDVDARMVLHRRVPAPQTFTPPFIFGVILRNFFDDILLVTAVVALAWYMNRQQSTNIGMQTAARLLRREVIEGEGSRLTAGAQPKSVFRSLFSMIVRAAASQHLGDVQYGAVLDDFVRFLNGMSERRVVPGRIYSSWGWSGLDAVRIPLLAMLAANMPSEGDDGVVAGVRELAAKEDLFPDGDVSLRRISQSLDAYARALGDGLDQNLFERGVRGLTSKADIAQVRSRLQNILSSSMAVLQEERTKRLRARPMDRTKLDTLAELLQNALSLELYCFSDYNIHKQDREADRTTTMHWCITGVDKGQFVQPPMSWESSNDLNQFIANEFRQHLTWCVWRGFPDRQRETVEVDPSRTGYWQAVIGRGNLLDRATLLVP